MDDPKLELKIMIGTIGKRVETDPKKSTLHLTVLYDEQEKQENINLFDNTDIKPEKVEELFVLRYDNELIVQEDEEKLDQGIWKLRNDSESEKKNNNNIPKVKINKRTR
jgi:hypothetical protein